MQGLEEKTDTESGYGHSYNRTSSPEMEQLVRIFKNTNDCLDKLCDTNIDRLINLSNI